MVKVECVGLCVCVCTVSVLSLRRFECGYGGGDDGGGGGDCCGGDDDGSEIDNDVDVRVWWW